MESSKISVLCIIEFRLTLDTKQKETTVVYTYKENQVCNFQFQHSPKWSWITKQTFRLSLAGKFLTPPSTALHAGIDTKLSGIYHSTSHHYKFQQKHPCLAFSSTELEQEKSQLRRTEMIVDNLIPVNQEKVLLKKQPGWSGVWGRRSWGWGGCGGGVERCVQQDNFSGIVLWCASTKLGLGASF